ncbi:hypothetical protein, partial [Aestuariicoccus sp. MJ-SS9]|uniref:hypothetical protein n=1 Tax=Aestuariicoccus sp. MJ-SS9 TaxID=3079855 RepID=UPI00290F55A0
SPTCTRPPHKIPAFSPPEGVVQTRLRRLPRLSCLAEDAFEMCEGHLDMSYWRVCSTDLASAHIVK